MLSGPPLLPRGAPTEIVKEKEDDAHDSQFQKLVAERIAAGNPERIRALVARDAKQGANLSEPRPEGNPPASCRGSPMT